MDVDGDDNETQQALKVTDYGIKVDFEELGEDEEEVCARLARHQTGRS